MDDDNGNDPDRELVFTFECPRSWESLSPTTNPSVRHCGQCNQAVYLCQDAEDARMHARVAHCVAVPTPGSPYRGMFPAPPPWLLRRGEPRPIRMGVIWVGPDCEPALVLGWLVPLDGPQRGQVFKLNKGTFVIGSGDTADVRLEGKHIRPEHCRIVARNDECSLEARFFLVDAHVDDPNNQLELTDRAVFVVGETRVVFREL